MNFELFLFLYILLLPNSSDFGFVHQLLLFYQLNPFQFSYFFNQRLELLLFLCDLLLQFHDLIVLGYDVSRKTKDLSIVVALDGGQFADCVLMIGSAFEEQPRPFFQIFVYFHEFFDCPVSPFLSLAITSSLLFILPLQNLIFSRLLLDSFDDSRAIDGFSLLRVLRVPVYRISLCFRDGHTGYELADGHVLTDDRVGVHVNCFHLAPRSYWSVVPLSCFVALRGLLRCVHYESIYNSNQTQDHYIEVIKKEGILKRKN